MHAKTLIIDITPASKSKFRESTLILVLQKSGDIGKARALSNPDNAPHLRFIDMGGHGYTVVRASAEAFETEFVCIQRPVESSTAADGGALVYRVKHHAVLRKKGEAPQLEQHIVEGDPKLSI